MQAQDKDPETLYHPREVAHKRVNALREEVKSLKNSQQAHARSSVMNNDYLSNFDYKIITIN